MNLIKLPFNFDELLLKKDLDYCQSYKWVNHYNTMDYMGNWEIISLRAKTGNQEDILIVPNVEYQDTLLLEGCHYFKQIIDSFEFEKQSIRLMSLSPGSTIKNHKDVGLGYKDGFLRLHIPIITEPEVLFYFDEVSVHMRQGECWYANFNILHRVEHNGTKNRIHLVIDGIRNEWSDILFMKEGYNFLKDEEEDKKKLLEDLPKIIAQLEKMDTEKSKEMIVELMKQFKS